MEKSNIGRKDTQGKDQKIYIIISLICVKNFLYTNK